VPPPVPPEVGSVVELPEPIESPPVPPCDEEPMLSDPPPSLSVAPIDAVPSLSLSPVVELWLSPAVADAWVEEPPPLQPMATMEPPSQRSAADA